MIPNVICHLVYTKKMILDHSFYISNLDLHILLNFFLDEVLNSVVNGEMMYTKSAASFNFSCSNNPKSNLPSSVHNKNDLASIILYITTGPLYFNELFLEEVLN